MVPEVRAILRDAARAYVDSVVRTGAHDSGDAAFCSNEIRELALELVAQELSAYMHRLNIQNRPSSLPAEILAGVFIHLSVQDRFSASEVCRQWRTAAVCFACVWTNLTEFGMIAPRLAVALARTGSLSVRLGFVFDLPPRFSTTLASAALRSLLSQVALHVHHLSALRVTVLSACTGLSLLSDALTVPARILAELAIHVVPESGDRAALRDDLFAGHAPKLARLSLSHVLLPQTAIPAFASVAYLYFTTRFERPRSYETMHLGLPNLVEYELDVLNPNHHHNHSLASLQPAPKLQIFRMPRACRKAVISLRFHARCPRISMGETAWTQVADIWESALSAPTRVIVLRTLGSTLLGGQDDGGMTRLFRGINDYRHTAELLAHAAPHLRALVMDTGRRLSSDSREMSFPILQHLHIVIPPTEDSPLPARPLLPVWIRAPALSTLRIDVSDLAADTLSGELALFVERVGCHTPLSLELKGAEDVRIPEGIMPRPVFNMLDVLKLGDDPVDVLENWDDWLAGALEQMQDL